MRRGPRLPVGVLVAGVIAWGLAASPLSAPLAEAGGRCGHACGDSVGAICGDPVHGGGPYYCDWCRGACVFCCSGCVDGCGGGPTSTPVPPPPPTSTSRPTPTRTPTATASPSPTPAPLAIWLRPDHARLVGQPAQTLRGTVTGGGGPPHGITIEVEAPNCYRMFFNLMSDAGGAFVLTPELAGDANFGTTVNGTWRAVARTGGGSSPAAVWDVDWYPVLVTK